MKLGKKLNYRLLLPGVLAVAALATGYVIAAPFYSGGLKPALSGAVSQAIPATHDLVQHIAVMQDFDKVLRAGVYYPRWLPDINHGYGLPWMNYYPPGFYYLTSLVHAFSPVWMNTLFVVSVLGFAASGLGFYFLSRIFYSRLASAIAGILYMAFPFHVLELYWRGAMPQFLGYVFLPLILYFGFKAGAFGKAYNYAGLGLFYGLDLITHTPTGLLMTYAMAFYALVWAFWQKDWKIALRISVGMVIGLLLASIFLLPAALETKDIQEHFTAIFPYHSSYLTLLPGDEFANVVNLAFVCQALTIIAAVVILRPVFLPDENQAEEVHRLQTRLLLLMSIVTTFMATSLSIYVSKLLPKIQVATFAWRWLAVASLFTALVGAAAIDRLQNYHRYSTIKLWSYRAALSVVIVFSIWVTADNVIGGARSHPIHNQPANYVEAGFTPKDSTIPQNLPDTDKATVKSGNGVCEIVRWEPYEREIIVNCKEISAVRLKTYNFPGWMARVDSQQVPVASDNDGVQIVEVPAGRHGVNLSFHNTPTRTIGAILSGLGFLTIVGLTLASGLRRNRHRTEVPREAAVLGNEAEIAAKMATADDMLAGERATIQERAKRIWADKRTRRIAIISLLALTGVFALAIITGLFAAKETNRNRLTRGEAITVGSEARLQVQGLDWIMVATDDSALNELMNALPARDDDKIESLVQSGKVLRVRNGTRVRVLELGFSKTRVSILEGEKNLTQGWVPEQWVRN